MAITQLQDTYHQARRANRSGGLVQLAGDLGLLAAFFFWGWVLWGFVKPGFLSPQNTLTIESAITGAFLAAFTIILALCCAVVMPALCAAIFPHTAAAQYLQEIRRSAWGFWLLSTSCAILVGFTLYVLHFWWSGRLGIADPATGLIIAAPWLVRSLTIMTAIFFIVVPSWAANYGTPVLWLTEVQQAHQVEKLKLTHKQDIALAKAAYRRALNILKAGLDSATVEQREYVAGVLIGLHKAERSLMLDIAGTLDEDARLEREIPAYDDPRVVQGYDDLHRALVDGTPTQRGDTHVDPYANTRLQPLESRSAESGIARHSQAESDSLYVALRGQLPDPFTAQNVTDAMQWKDKRPAQRLIQEWLGTGRINQIRLGRYSFTESEA